MSHRSSRVAALAFHKIGEPPPSAQGNQWYIPEAVFRAHLRYLSSGGWEVITADTFLGALSTPENLPEHAVLLTFDDAYKSLLGSASRCLREFNYPAVVFAPTDFVGRSNEFDLPYGQPEEAICSWDDLRELRDRGFSIQSHGMRHESFESLNPDRQEQELRLSKSIIEAEIGKSVQLFAYPFGRVPSDRHALSERLERLGYRAAFRFGGGFATIPAADGHFLPRVDMYPNDDLASKLGS